MVAAVLALAALIALAAGRWDIALGLALALIVLTWVAAPFDRTQAADAPLTPDAPLRGADDASLAQAMDVLPDPIIVIDAGAEDDVGRRWVRYANPAAIRLMRIPRQGAALTSAIRDPDVLEAIEEALFGRLTQIIGYETGGAQDRYWRAWTAPLPTAEGQEARALVRLRDETDSRRAEMMRVDFLANASHELRTPLASLGGFIETLKGHARDDVRARDKFLDIMAAQTERMGRLVADLLSLSRIEMNEHVPPSGRVDLGAVIADVVDASDLLSADKGVTLTVRRSPGRAMVVGDRDQLIQVVQNLVDNALKYSPTGGEVEIVLADGMDLATATSWSLSGANRLPLLSPDAHEGALYGLIAVRDRGPGLEREHLPRLTERFYRVEGQKSGERMGTGLGLAIVKHIVNRHRGGMIVESTPGDGSSFIVYFPLVEAARDASPAM